MLIMWKKKSQRRKWGIPYCSPVPLSFATIWRTEQMFICWFFHLGGVSGPLGASPFPLIKEWIKYWNFWKLANLNKDRYFMSEGRFKLGTGSPVYEGFYLSPAPRFQHNMDCTPTTTLQNQTLGPSVPTTGHQCQEAVLLASQDNWQITGSFSTTVCQTVYSVTQKSRPLQHSVLWKENKVYQVPLFILSSRLLFFILLAFQHVLECAAGNGSERKGQRLPLEAGSHDCRVSYVMPEGVMPITLWDLRARAEPETWTVVLQDSPESKWALLRSTKKASESGVEIWQGRERINKRESQILNFVFVSLGCFKCVGWFWVFGVCLLLLRFAFI